MKEGGGGTGRWQNSPLGGEKCHREVSFATEELNLSNVGIYLKAKLFQALYNRADLATGWRDDPMIQSPP